MNHQLVVSTLQGSKGFAGQERVLGGREGTAAVTRPMTSVDTSYYLYNIQMNYYYSMFLCAG